MGLREILKPRFVAIGSHLDGVWVSPERLIELWKVNPVQTKSLNISNVGALQGWNEEWIIGLVPLCPMHRYWDAMLCPPFYPFSPAQAKEFVRLLREWNGHHAYEVLLAAGVQCMEYE
jgi:hypothetical protein